MPGPLLGYLLAVLIGVTLGLLGGGGSILMVPVLVYVMGIDPKAAIAMSLPMVGLSSLVAASRHWRQGNVDLRTALTVGLAALAGSWAVARLSHRIPGGVQLTILGGIIVVAAILMLARKDDPEAAPRAPRPVAAGVLGLLVGGVTGLVGIGGGFMFVPALTLFGGLPMKRAIGTSLVIIVLNTIGGSIGYAGQGTIDWSLVLVFTALMIAGSLIGERISGRVPGARLRQWFAWFLVMIGVLILWENVR